MKKKHKKTTQQQQLIHTMYNDAMIKRVTRDEQWWKSKQIKKYIHETN